MMLNTERQRPKYLNWKCIDNFDKVSENKIFYDCKDIKLNEIQRRECRKHFAEIKNKWSKVLSDFLEEANSQNKTHLKIAGGNYTFFFVLPHIIEWTSRKYPFLGIEIELFERGGNASLEDQSADMILTSESRDGGYNTGNLSKAGYKKTRKIAWDGMFFASSKESVEAFGSKENALKFQDILFGRIYATESSVQETKKLYSIIPEGRENSAPRVTVDQYFLEYLLLSNSAGIGYLYTSFKMSEKVTKLSDSLIEEYQRFTIIRNNTNKKYNAISRRLVNRLIYGG